MNAFWMSPSGRVFVIPVFETHIGLIIKSPDLFGLSYQDIKDAFEKHHERMGMEGEARIEVMSDLLKKGWVRARERQNGWVVEYWKDSSSFRGNLFGVLDEWVSKGKIYPDDIFEFYELSTGNRYTHFVKEFIGQQQACAGIPLLLKWKYKVILSSSVTRLWSAVVTKKPFAILTSKRGKGEDQASKNKFMSLLKEVADLNLGYVITRGSYDEVVEGMDTRMWFEQDSIYVPNMSKASALALGKKYDQESVIVADEDSFGMYSTLPESYGQVLTKFDRSDPRMSVKFFTTLVEDYYTRLKFGGPSKTGMRLKFLPEKEVVSSFTFQEREETSMMRAMVRHYCNKPLKYTDLIKSSWTSPVVEKR